MPEEDPHPLSREEMRLVHRDAKSPFQNHHLAPYLDHRLSQNSLIHLQDHILNLLVGHPEGTQKDSCQKMRYKDMFSSLPPSSPSTSLCWTIFLPVSALLKSLSETSTSSTAYIVRIQVPEPIQCLRFPPPNFLSLIPALMSHTSRVIPSTAFYKHWLYAFAPRKPLIFSIYIKDFCPVLF